MEHRRISKQVMERQRRARINASLDRLKQLLQANKLVDPDRIQRLEKADILELTVALLLNGSAKTQSAAMSFCCKSSASSTVSALSTDEESSQSMDQHQQQQKQQQQQQQQNQQCLGQIKSVSDPSRRPLSTMDNHRQLQRHQHGHHCQEGAQPVWRPW